MKVFDLQCPHGHGFEGWFSSEDDFQTQLARQMVACPLCGDTSVAKLPSAPRLNLRATTPAQERASTAAPGDSAAASHADANPGTNAHTQAVALQSAWLKAVRHVMAHTEDVGDRFAEEARRMHYGEADERGIRGQATREQTESLLNEGIAVMPLPIPDGFKNPLQ